MSRLIVRNLPKKITEEDLRRIFSEKGTITDIQLKYTPQGKFRQFAFIGYQTENEAKEAIESFDKMCIKTSRLDVSLCESLGTKKEKKTDEKVSLTVETDKKKSKVKVSLLEKYMSDPHFEEFMNSHAIGENISSKDTDKSRENLVNESYKEQEQEDTSEKLANFQITDDEYKKTLMNGLNKASVIESSKREVERKHQLYTVKLKGLPYTCKKKDLKKFFSPLVPFTIRLPPKIKGIAYVGFKEEGKMNKALLKNRSFLDGKRITVVKYVSNEKREEERHPLCQKWKKQEETLAKEESIAESGRIFIRNLSYTITENDIEQLFGKYGPLAEIKVPIDSFTKKPKGFAVVTFVLPENAIHAYTDLDGIIFQGRLLHLLPGKAKEEDFSTTEDNSSYKQKKQALDKKRSGSSHNWNSLFLGHNAVAEAIANSHGVSKEDILTPHENDAAVRLALGETKIVATTRKFLEDHGVILDTFANPNPERSNTIILVKNLPFNTEVAAIRKVFEKFGTLGRIILPPSGITAIVEFLEPSEAKAAFKKLAYSKFVNVPLFLEWAPKDSLQDSTVEYKEVDTKPEKQEDRNIEPEEGTTIFVKNLNFETTDESLKKHFESFGDLKYAKVARKINKNNPQNQLSMGFGFVQYFHKSCADAALKNLQQSELDGKSLELKRSERTLKEEIKFTRKAVEVKKQTGTKILVRNVPFQANKKEMWELFRTFGEIKALRMPKKVSTDSDSHRGFAFVDYAIENDAKAAFDALCQSTHLYGRRLVLEWATKEENVEQIRKRTAEHFTPQKTVTSKKSVFNITAE